MAIEYAKSASVAFSVYCEIVLVVKVFFATFNAFVSQTYGLKLNKRRRS
jgi:hypothetical protein